MKLINIGFGNMLSSGRIVAIVAPDSAPIKRIISDSREKGLLIDATQGRKTKSVIITDSEHIVLTYLSAEVLTARIDEADKEEEAI